ncbi:hypothetical protein CR513_22681 [Mucuna pruriens]|uniref:Borealin C-terminal domain-containing protein n=1 Tax=Mucuna pruriens TaxID=157652 RepID=A0A371GWM6_MUCPR|nr:hypothetical protein CR513_22681 [Mucuna pruriens]
MPKRRTKKTAKATEPIPEPQTQTQPPQFIDLEIQAMERQIGAIRAVRDVEIEHLLTELRLLRSRFSSEELQKPLLQVFEETLPNLSVVNDEGSKKVEVKWREKESCNDGMDVHASLLQRLSIASIPRFPGFEYSTNAAGTSLVTGRMSFIGADNLHFDDIALEEPSDTQTLALQEGLQTPGVTSQRLSVGMTPKTLRLPKPGEMLLSVHGSPLGVYKENNMEAIHGMKDTSSFSLDSQLDDFSLATSTNFGMGCNWKGPTELSDYCSIMPIRWVSTTLVGRILALECYGSTRWASRKVRLNKYDVLKV